MAEVITVNTSWTRCSTSDRGTGGGGGGGGRGGGEGGEGRGGERE